MQNPSSHQMERAQKALARLLTDGLSTAINHSSVIFSTSRLSAVLLTSPLIEMGSRSSQTPNKDDHDDDDDGRNKFLIL